MKIILYVMLGGWAVVIGGILFSLLRFFIRERKKERALKALYAFADQCLDDDSVRGQMAQIARDARELKIEGWERMPLKSLVKMIEEKRNKLNTKARN